MIIVDTSIWVDMFRGRPTSLEVILQQGQALLHPFVLGELQLGGLPRRGLDALVWPDVRVAPLGDIDEVGRFIEAAELTGTGLGYVDVHLLVSAILADGKLMSSDKKLHAQAQRLGIAYTC